MGKSKIPLIPLFAIVIKTKNTRPKITLEHEYRSEILNSEINNKGHGAQFK